MHLISFLKILKKVIMHKDAKKMKYVIDIKISAKLTHDNLTHFCMGYKA